MEPKTFLKWYCGIAVVTFVTVFFYVILRGPSYKVGECYYNLEKAEESWQEDSKSMIKIEKVGRKNYGYRYYWPELGYNDRLTTNNFGLVQRVYDNKTECPNE